MRTLAFALAALLPLTSCLGNGGRDPDNDGMGGGGGNFGKLKPPDLVVSELEILESGPGPFGTTAMKLRIRVANLKPNKPFGLPTNKPFRVSVAITNPLLPDDEPVPGAMVGIAAPLGFELFGPPSDLRRTDDSGLDPGPPDGPYLWSPPTDLLISLPIQPGQYVELVRTAYVHIPWDLPLVDTNATTDPNNPVFVPLQVTATADWTDVIKERDDDNNATTVPYGS